MFIWHLVIHCTFLTCRKIQSRQEVNNNIFSTWFVNEFEYNKLRMAAQLNLDLSHAQQERLLRLNGLDEHRMQALLHLDVVQL